jgi:hypothetical protein
MGGAVEELTVNYEEDGKLVVKELDKAILSKGAWSTVVFRFVQWDEKLGGYGPERYVIKRYKKVGGEYRSQSKFTISSAEQAKKLVEILSRWAG